MLFFIIFSIISKQSPCEGSQNNLSVSGLISSDSETLSYSRCCPGFSQLLASCFMILTLWHFKVHLIWISETSRADAWFGFYYQVVADLIKNDASFRWFDLAVVLCGWFSSNTLVNEIRRRLVGRYETFGGCVKQNEVPRLKCERSSGFGSKITDML